jgi:hypothetical protein
MNSIIVADSARLAGLQIDLLQKLRQGQITADQLEWFNKLTKEVREDVLAGRKLIMEPPQPPEPKGSLEWIQNLGMLEVPDGYVHETRLDDFCAAHDEHRKFTWTGRDLSSKKNSKASVQLKPGQVFWVDAYMWFGPRTTLRPFIDLLKGMKALFLGAHGASLVLELMSKEMIRDRSYCSLDECECLPRCDGSFCGLGVAAASTNEYGEWHFGVHQLDAIINPRVNLILRFSDPR